MYRLLPQPKKLAGFRAAAGKYKEHARALPVIGRLRCPPQPGDRRGGVGVRLLLLRR